MRPTTIASLHTLAADDEPKEPALKDQIQSLVNDPAYKDILKMLDEDSVKKPEIDGDQGSVFFKKPRTQMPILDTHLLRMAKDADENGLILSIGLHPGSKSFALFVTKKV